jgi:hypothetical protein
MQVIRNLEQEAAALVGWGVRVMLLAPDSTADRMQARIAGLGGVVERQGELFSALDSLIDDPAGYGLFVVDVDGYGGVKAMSRAMAMLGEVRLRVPAIFVSRDCAEQIFPDDRHEPVCLRAPLSAVALRVGLEHALRDRLRLRAA